MDFRGASRPDHLYDFPACRSADEGVIDEDHALSFQQVPHWIELHFDTEMPDRLARFNECSANVVVANQAEGERDGVPDAEAAEDADGRPADIPKAADVGETVKL